MSILEKAYTSFLIAFVFYAFYLVTYYVEAYK